MTPDPATWEAVIAEVLAAHRMMFAKDCVSTLVCECGHKYGKNGTLGTAPSEAERLHVASVLAARLTDNEGMLLAALAVPGEQPCPECDGTGYLEHLMMKNRWQSCPAPSAETIVPGPPGRPVKQCPSCRGTGTVPGDHIREVLESFGVSQAELARRCGWSTKHINRVIQGAVPISVWFACALEDALGVPSAQFWMNLQTAYDIGVLRGKKVVR